MKKQEEFKVLCFTYSEWTIETLGMSSFEKDIFLDLIAIQLHYGFIPSVLFNRIDVDSGLMYKFKTDSNGDYYNESVLECIFNDIDSGYDVSERESSVSECESSVSECGQNVVESKITVNDTNISVVEADNSVKNGVLNGVKGVFMGEFNTKNVQTNESKPKKKVYKPQPIPELSVFLEYCKTIAPDNYETIKQSLELKYISWVESGWKNGYRRPIINWKSSIANTIPHLIGVRSTPKSKMNDIINGTNEILAQYGIEQGITSGVSGTKNLPWE